MIKPEDFIKACKAEHPHCLIIERGNDCNSSVLAYHGCESERNLFANLYHTGYACVYYGKDLTSKATCNTINDVVTSLHNLK